MDNRRAEAAADSPRALVVADSPLALVVADSRQAKAAADNRLPVAVVADSRREAGNPLAGAAVGSRLAEVADQS